MNAKSEKVKRWREHTKKIMIESMGGKCCICGYNKCIKSMDFHHLNPEEKERGLGSMLAHPTKWGKIILELRKCVLICSNCHGELHDGLISIPVLVPRFNEAYVEKENQELSSCPICGKPKPSYLFTCSRRCASSKTSSVDWSKIDVLKLKQEGLSNDKIGGMVGVTGDSVRKRIKALLKNVEIICSYCGKIIRSNHGNQRYCSEKCARMARRKVTRPTKEQLEKEILELPMTTIGKKYGVSDNAIRKWAKSHGIIS